MIHARPYPGWPAGLVRPWGPNYNPTQQPKRGKSERGADRISGFEGGLDAGPWIMIREVAKFAAGVTAWEALTHASFAASGVLPMKLCGITLTPKLNTVQIVIPALTSAALVYIGWVRSPTATGR